MGLLDGLGKWLKGEFDSITGQPQPSPQPVTAPQPSTVPQPQPWHAPMALPTAPNPATPPTPSQPKINLAQPPSQPSQIKLQPNAYPNVDPTARQQIISGTHLNDQQKQKMLQGLNDNAPKPFNPVTAGVQSLGEGARDIAGSIATPFVNTARLPIDAARVALAPARRPDQQAQNDLASDTVNNIFYNPLTQKTADLLSTAAYQPFEDQRIKQAHDATISSVTAQLGNTPQARNYAESLANANDQQIYDTELAQQGLTPNDSALKVAWRVGAPVVAGLAQAPLMATGAGEGAAAAEQGLLPVLKSATTYGALGGATGALGTASDPNATPLDYAKAFGEGFTGGALMPLAGAGVHAVAPLAASAAKVGAGKLSDFMSAPAAHAAEQATGISRQNIINENEAGTLRDYADYKTGDYNPDVPTVNNLLKQARNAAQTAGIDVTSGSPRDITDRIYNYLSKRQQFINTHDSVMQGGYARVPFLENGESEVDPISQEYAAEKAPQEIIKEHADMLRSLDTGAQGGVITAQGTRISEHTPFYREYYAEHGRAPSKAAYVEQATKELEAGKGDMLDPGMAEAYHLAKQRDADNAALVDRPNPELAQDSYYYGPNLNEGAFSRIDRTKLQGRALDIPNRELTTASGIRTQTPEESSLQSQLPTNRDQASSKGVVQIAQKGRIRLNREAGLPNEIGSYSEHTPNAVNGANMTPEDINRLREQGVAQYEQNQFPAAGGDHMADLTDKQMREIVLEGNRRSDAEEANVTQRHAILDNAIARGVAPGEDRVFFEAVEHPEKLQDILKTVANPDKFAKAVQEMRDFNNFAAQRTIETGTPLHIRENYLRHNVDLSDPEQLRRYQELARARGRLSIPGYSKDRIFDDLNDLEKNGFALKYSTARDLARDYANNVSGTTSRNALVNYLKEHAPGHITTVDTEGGMIPLDRNGREFMTGRSNGLQRTFLSPQLADKVQRYVEPIKLGAVAKGIDAVGQTLKQSTLALGGFHDLNVTKRYITQEIASGITGEPKRLLNSVLNSAKQDAAFWSKNYYAHELTKFRDSGLLDRATHDGNLTLDHNIDTGSLEKALNGKKSIALKQTGDNTLEQDGLRTALNSAGDKAKQVLMIPHNVNEFIHEYLFGRKIPLMKLQTLQSEMERNGIPLKGDLTEAQRTKLVALTDQINNTYGGINKGLIMKSGAGKYIQRQLMLAPDFTGGNLNSVIGMLHGDAKSLAWRQNMGNYLSGLVAATVATGLVAAASGHDGKQAAEDKLKKMLTPGSGTFLTPSIDLPYTDSKGNHLVVSMPGSPVEEAAKLRDPAHFLISRGGAGVRNATEYMTNQNYNGQPLVDPYQNPNPSAVDKLQALAGSNLPIPAAQGIQMANGKQNLATTALNTAGLRVTKDPTDPKVQQANAYFDQYNKFVATLNPNERAALQIVQPTQKDRNGNYVIAPTVFDTPDKAETLLRFPNVLNGLTALNQKLAASGQKVDPFYTELNPDQQRALLARDTINKNNTQQLTAWDQQNKDWYAGFQQDRSVFYNSLPPTDPNKPKNPIQPPVETPDIQALYSQVDQITDPKAKATFYAAHPELTDYQQQMAQYTNKVLVASGLTPLKLPPVADKDTQSYMSTYMAANPSQRAQMKAGNPDGYNKMEAYMQNVAEYEVAKNGALDQLQGQTPNQSLLRGINSLASYDMVRNPDGTLALKYGSVNPGATDYGSVAATPQAGATQNGVGGHSAHKKSHHIYMKTTKPIKVHHMSRPKKIYLETPVSPVRIRNRANKHVGIHRTTYL